MLNKLRPSLETKSSEFLIYIPNKDSFKSYKKELGGVTGHTGEPTEYPCFVRTDIVYGEYGDQFTIHKFLYANEIDILADMMFGTSVSKELAKTRVSETMEKVLLENKKLKKQIADCDCQGE